MTHEQRPGRVPDDPAHGAVPSGFDVDDGDPSGFDARYDTDGDGRADTAVTDDGVDLLLLTDLDGNGVADQILRIGPDGVVREAAPDPPAGPGGGLLDGLRCGVDAGYEL